MCIALLWKISIVPIKIENLFFKIYKMGNYIHGSADPGLWEVIDFNDNNEIHYYKEVSDDTTSQLICNEYCFNPNCYHDKFGPEGRVDPCHPYIANTYYTDEDGNIVGYNFKGPKNTNIPNSIVK